MRLKVIALCVLSFLCLFSAQAQTLNTEKSSVTINEKNAELQLVFESSNKSFKSQVSLELLDKFNNVIAKTYENLRIKKGAKSYDFSLPLGNMLENHEDEIIWYRLRYSVGDKTGIVSLSELVRNNFELRVIATENIVAGMNYRSRILAINPIDKTPVKDVRITASLTVEIEDEDELTFKSKGKTNKDGFAILDFQIPTSATLDSDSDLKVVGKKNGLIRQAKESLDNVTDDFSFLMLTDKPIYQPEQELKIRGILLKGTEGKTVVADAELEFNIKDGENTLLYKETVKTSDFGVASIVWEIPENAKLGDYNITVKTLEGDNVGNQKVKISRYDLPNFAVKPKPGKTFYLPEENEAEIEVKADYLFGKPVTKSKVRIVEEKSRQWNWKKQKYDIDEGQVREGEADADGKFTAKIDLKKFHEDIADNDWRKFQDISLTAYVTDLTSNKTEQRRFDIRVTKEPIHVYYIGNRDEINSNTPVTAYVSTFYADGSPAVCDVEFEGREDNKSKKFQTIKKIKTNSYGAGKLEFKRPKFIEEDDYKEK